jgi:hypothetical protein
VRLLADRVAAAVPPDLLPPPAQPLTGVPAFAAGLAALACCAAASSTLLWRARASWRCCRSPPPDWLLMLASVALPLPLAVLALQQLL